MYRFATKCTTKKDSKKHAYVLDYIVYLPTVEPRDLISSSRYTLE